MSDKISGKKLANKIKSHVNNVYFVKNNINITQRNNSSSSSLCILNNKLLVSVKLYNYGNDNNSPLQEILVRTVNREGYHESDKRPIFIRAHQNPRSERTAPRPRTKLSPGGPDGPSGQG